MVVISFTLGVVSLSLCVFIIALQELFVKLFFYYFTHFFLQPSPTGQLGDLWVVVGGYLLGEYLYYLTVSSLDRYTIDDDGAL